MMNNVNARLVRQTWTALLLYVLFAAAAAAQTIWYQDNSFAKRGGLPDDFVYKFQNPDTWKAARAGLGVYMFRPNMFNRNYPQITDELLVKHMVPLLKEGRIEVALDTSGPLLSGCRDREQRIKADLAWVARLKRVGMPVNYVSLQSMLSKPHREAGEVQDCPIEVRVKGAIGYSRQLMKLYPDAAIGVIDALPSKGLPYREDYKYARDMFQHEKVPLRYIHMDVSAEMIWRGDNGLTWQKVIEVEQYVRKLGLKFGLYFTSRRAGHASDEAFYKTIVRALEDYRRAGGAADHYIITSWFPYPQQTVRRAGEAAGGYPVTDAILDFSQRIAPPVREEQKRRVN